jgi:hypothetical protein
MGTKTNKETRHSDKNKRNFFFDMPLTAYKKTTSKVTL